MERFQARGIEVGAPFVPDHLQHLIDYLFDVGPTRQSEAGEGPLDDVVLRAWQDNSGYGLEPWECRMLRRLSSDWLKQRQESEAENCRPPWQPSLPSRAEVARKIDELL